MVPRFAAAPLSGISWAASAAVFGGAQTGYINLVNQTRDEAIAALQAHAGSLGANAVLGMRFDSGEFDAGQGQAMNEITAYGTAVILEA